MTVVRDVPVSASVAPVPPPAGGSAHQVAPAPHDNGTRSGAATFACECSHSRHAHRGYGHCEEPGCTCWAFRRNQSNNKSTPRPLQPGRGA